MNLNSLNNSYLKFEKNINNSLNLISQINTINSNGNEDKISNEFYFQIIELSFLKIYLSWENFLEEAFLKLILVAKNNSKVTSYIRTKSYEHTMNLLKNNNKYPDWTDVDSIIFKANNYFLNGFPISQNLKLILTELKDMKTIRNSIVHMSKNSDEKFNNLVIRKMGSIPFRFSIGKFLLSNKDSNYTYLNYYVENLKIAAKNIVELKN